jgi:hypothetical protein
MKRAIRNASLLAAFAGAAVLSTPSAAQGQVRVEGRFRLPHGDVAVSVGEPYYAPYAPYYGGGYYHDVYYGAPAYPIGSYVPYGYRVIAAPRLGYGFYSPAFACGLHHVHHRHWIPVRRYSSRWVVMERPYFAGRTYYRGGYDGRRYTNRYDERRYSRRDPAYSGDPYYDFNRELWDRSYHPYDDPNYRARR